MEKLLKCIKFTLNLIINTIVLTGIGFALLWAIWDIKPQTSITKTAYFFSESWRIITGQKPSQEPIPAVTQDQLEGSQKSTHFLK
jgi:hypothetical protein